MKGPLRPGVDLPEEELSDKALDAISEFAEKATSDEDDLGDAVKDLIYGAEKRNGFREEYVVDAEDLRTLARLVDLDNYLEH